MAQNIAIVLFALLLTACALAPPAFF